MIKILNKMEEYLVALCLAIMIVLNFGNVLSRYVFKSSWSFTEEMQLILFIWVIMLASAIAYKRLEHLGLPLILDVVPKTIKKSLIIFAGLVSVFLIALLFISGVEMITEQIKFQQTTSVLGLPEWVAGISIPLGSIFIVIRVVQSTIHQLFND